MSVIENGSESEFGRDTLLDRAVHMTFKVAAIGIVFLIVAVAPSAAYLCRKEWLAEGSWLMAAASLLVPLALGLFATAVLRRFDVDLRDDRVFKRFVLGFVAVLLVCQAFVLIGARFSTGWDVWWLTLPRAYTHGDYLSESSVYFGGYPNQLFLYALFSAVDMACGALGVSSYPVLAAVGCLCVTIALAACLRVARGLWGPRGALVFAPIAFAYLGLNGWIMVPYSDSIGMFFTSAILCCYVCARTPLRRAVGMTAFTVVGYMIKPTIVFPVFAVVLLMVPRAFRTLGEWRTNGLDGAKARGVAAAAGASVLFAVALWCGCSAVKAWSFDADPDRAFSMTHFLMMGANDAAGGGYSLDDVEYSYSFDRPRERSRANIERWVRRVQEMGPAGVASLGLRKALTNFADGTFAWECEGDFYLQQRGRIGVVQDWYGTGEVGARPGSGLEYEVFCQVCWIATLIGCAAAPRCGGGRRAAMQLALLMLMVFLLVFEARARYVFLFAPYFVLLAVPGWMRIWDGVCILANRRLEGRC